jgi:ParB-like nuclease domain
MADMGLLTPRAAADGTLEADIASIIIGERHWRDLGDIGALAASIREIGLLHPIVIRPDCTLIAGERRLRAAELLGWTKIPVNVIDLDSVVRGESPRTLTARISPQQSWSLLAKMLNALSVSAQRNACAKPDGQKLPESFRRLVRPATRSVRAWASAAALTNGQRPSSSQLRPSQRSTASCSGHGPHQAGEWRSTAEDLPTGRADSRRAATAARQRALSLCCCRLPLASHRLITPYPPMTREEICAFPLRRF